MTRNSQAGFTIMELIVAMAFVGVVIVSMTDLFTGLRQINRAANNYTIATQVAQQIMEQYRNTPFSSLTLGTVDYSSYLTPYPSLLGPRSATATISQPGASGVDQVDVTVSYKDRTGTKTVSFSTQIANKGLNR
ncbi:MAG TPA: hypothetical protein VGH44_01600 [Candidatus Saccharimonadia bacterium]|jgi:Tfp pilus assembly protein PilV